MFSETRLDVSPLSRYNRAIGLIVNQSHNTPIGIMARQNYYYRLFWDECPIYEKAECSVEAKTDKGLIWSWKYKKANISELDGQMLMNNPAPVDSSTEFALWNWATSGIMFTQNHQRENVNIKVARAQILSPDGGLYLLPATSQAYSVCRYIDFASIKVQPQKLSLSVSKMLTKALKLINPRVTDVRLTDIETGLSVVLDDKHSVSLGTIGNGAVAWVSVLISILETLETIKFDPNTETPPILFLIDEIGAGVHFSVMLDMWKYIRKYAEEYPYIQFVTTSHSDDCVRAFCEAFSEEDNSSIVRLHKTAIDEKIVATLYNKEQYENIVSGNREVPG